MNKKNLYEQQEDIIRKQSEAFITLLTHRGILGEQSIDDEKLRNARQERKKNTYHNTLMLLKHYRAISWMLECFPDTIAEELDRSFEGIDELVDHIDVEMSMNNRKLESRMAGIQKSRLLLDRVNEALTVLKKKPNDGEKLYKATVINLPSIAMNQLLGKDIEWEYPQFDSRKVAHIETPVIVG